MPVLSETEINARGFAPFGEAYLEREADATTDLRANDARAPVDHVN
jgi:hypothetical protein